MQKGKKSISVKKVIKLLMMLIIALYITYIALMQAFIFVSDVYANFTTTKIESQADLIRLVSGHLAVPSSVPSFTYKVTEENLPGVLDKMPFLEGVEKDNFIVAYPGLFIVYDLKRDVLVKVVGGLKQ